MPRLFCCTRYASQWISPVKLTIECTPAWGVAESPTEYERREMDKLLAECPPDDGWRMHRVKAVEIDAETVMSVWVSQTKENLNVG